MDRRVQIILRAVKSHPDHSLSELWSAVLSEHAEGYGGQGRVNYGYLERTMPRLQKAGLLAKGAKHRLRITEAGIAALEGGAPTPEEG